MFPILFEWGPLRLHTYGLMAAIGFLAGYALASWRARRAGSAVLSPTLVSDALTPLVIGGIVGARIFYVVFHATEFSGAWVDTLKIWQGGLMWQGGFLGALTALAVFARKKNVPFLVLADLLAPSVALGQAVGRIGCLFAGCCYGRACDRPWAITFQHPESLAPTGTPLHPTQLYDMGLNLLIAGILLLADRPDRHRRPGRLAGLYLVLAGCARLAVEPFRADDRGIGVSLFSATGLVALGLVLSGLILFYFRRHRTRHPI